MLVWIDLETTGLDPAKDRILEIAVIITDDELIEVARCSAVTDVAHRITWDSLHSVVQEMHMKNGLWEESLKSARPAGGIDREVAAFLGRHNAVGAQLAGSTISFDRSFLKAWMPITHESLHYRNLDVSTLNEVARRVWPEIYEPRPVSSSTHRAMPDIETSITLLKHYLRRLRPTVL